MSTKVLVNSWSRMIDKYLDYKSRIDEVVEIAKLGELSSHEKQMLEEEYVHLINDVRKISRLIAIAEKVYALTKEEET